MIRSIQRLRGFGVFEDFRRTNDLPEFGAKNIIYGWNYSGKTTLSRFFSTLGTGIPSPDFPLASFEVRLDDGTTITERALDPPRLTIEVFNSDFVTSNLSWSGEDFQSILLLGDDSIEAQERIERLNTLLGKRRQQLRSTRASIKEVEETISEAKSVAAKQIKTTLQIVEAFGATQLNSALAQLPADIASVILSPEEFAAQLNLALAKDAQRPTNAPAFAAPNLQLSGWQKEAETLLREAPVVSAILEHLRDHPAISNWVEAGLPLHAGHSVCEFCGGALTDERIRSLQGHFSKAWTDHKQRLETLLRAIQSAALSLTGWIEPSRFLPANQLAARLLAKKLEDLCRAYNDDLRNLAEAVQAKVDNPFETQSQPALRPEMPPVLTRAFDEVEALIARNNRAVSGFKDPRGEAIRKSKLHLVATFAQDERLAKAQQRRNLLTDLESYINAAGIRIRDTVQVLHASIDRAQKGRETLNERIALLLESDGIRIDVVTRGGTDRFALRRNGHPARNLSDGERTAIAFAYFLTKLKEHKNLEDVIVYIDDPISSLDSNHVFQVYAIIKNLFFRKSVGAQGKAKWVTACKQLFISTHNFEFFEMLKKLPIDGQKPTQRDGARYYLIKRITSTASSIFDLPASLRKYTSEYHYLFSVINAFYEHPTKDDVAQLLALPNALRRFVELYTYMRLPLADTNVEARLGLLLGSESAVRITQLLHHFSHLETVDRVSSHTQVVSAIAPVVDELMELLSKDELHFNALMATVSSGTAAA